MSDEDKSLMYAKRAIERKKRRSEGRSKTMSTEARLTLQNKILADRLALALHVMTSHEQFIKYETTVEWMKYLEDWTEELLTVEERPKHKRLGWRFDYLRKQQRYTYLKNSIRGFVRRQVAAITGVPHETEQDGHTEVAAGADDHRHVVGDADGVRVDAVP